MLLQLLISLVSRVWPLLGLQLLLWAFRHPQAPGIRAWWLPALLVQGAVLLAQQLFLQSVVFPLLQGSGGGFASMQLAYKILAYAAHLGIAASLGAWMAGHLAGSPDRSQGGLWKGQLALVLASMLLSEAWRRILPLTPTTLGWLSPLVSLLQTPITVVWAAWKLDEQALLPSLLGCLAWLLPPLGLLMPLGMALGAAPALTWAVLALLVVFGSLLWVFVLKRPAMALSLKARLWLLLLFVGIEVPLALAIGFFTAFAMRS